MNDLQEILTSLNLNIASNPLGTDKGDQKSYVDKFYATAFADYRFDGMRLMEIGCRHGASLALWSSYFPNGEIVGCDNLEDPMLTEETYVVREWVERPNVSLVIGDAYAQETADSLTGIFDIIIDDGPHSLSSQQRALDLYLPKLAPNGLFVVEDVLTGGGAILPLLRHVPDGYTVTFHDFRMDKMLGDNCIVAVRKRAPSLWEWIGIYSLGLFYSITEMPARRILQLVRGD